MTTRSKILTGFSLVGVTAIALVIAAATGSLSNGHAQATTTLAAIGISSSGSDDLDAGRHAMSAGKLELAECLLSRAYNNQPGDFDRLRTLVSLLMSQAKLKLNAGDHSAATERLAIASKAIGTSMKAGFNQMNASKIQQYLDLQKTVDSLQQTVNVNAVAIARHRIGEANRLANDGHHWYRPNSRDHVRWGLENLSWVKERFDLIDPWTRSLYHRSLNGLKSMVSDNEWTPLTAEAGFVEKNA